MPKKLKYVQSFGGYNYLRYKHQSKVALPPGPSGGAAFMAAYKQALANAQARDEAKQAQIRTKQIAKKKEVTPGLTVREVVAGHLSSKFFRDVLKPGTQVGRRSHLLGWAEGRKQQGLMACGHLPILDMDPEDIGRELSQRREIGGLAAGRNWLIAVRTMIAERRDAGVLPKSFDPTLGLKGSPQRRGRRKDDGFKTWTRDMIKQYRGYWPSGTRQRVAFEMLYVSGAACCDVIKLTRTDIIDGLFRFDRQKTDTMSCPPVAPELLAEIAAAKIELGPIVRDRRGQPFKNAQAFGIHFVRWAKEAGIPAGYSAHGIRKRAATDDAEAGMSTTWLKAKYGWLRSSEADLYTDAADRVRVIKNEERTA